MKIKRFFAATMREAIARVRAELGPDALIVSSKRAEGGIEIVAAVDYDERLAQEALAAHARTAVVDSTIAAAALQPPEAATEPPSAIPPAVPPRASLLEMLRDAMRSKRSMAAATVNDSVAAEPSGQAAQTVAAAPLSEIPSVRSQDPLSDGARSEVELMRRQLELRLSGRAWHDLTRRQPARARVLHDLAALDIAPEIALQLCNEMPELESTEDLSRIPLALLALLVRRLPVADDRLLEEGGVVAVVGRSGVGKTTTIAKLAATFALRHGARQVALVSIDGYRRGAREQLLGYARIIGVPMHVAADARGLAEVLDALEPRKLVLIDTAGRSRRDLRLTEQLAALAQHGERIRILLALAANTGLAELDDTVRMFARLKPSACVLTKVDVADSLGAALSTVIRYQLPIAHLTDGQSIPESLHTGLSRCVWLVLRAAELQERSGRIPDEMHLAEHCGPAVAHA
jgi:flagellar biosynthesis protein FlhF